jgi:phage gpG-like protein
MPETFTSNAPELAAQLHRFAARVDDPRPALERMRAMLAAGEEEVWGTRGSAIGFYWAPPAEPERKTNSAQLVETGALRNSLTNPSAGLSPSEVELRFGTDIPYAHFHQFGTRKMPRRSFLGIPPEIDQGVTDVLAAMIEEAE